jgi:hypothetical protein
VEYFSWQSQDRYQARARLGDMTLEEFVAEHAATSAVEGPGGTARPFAAAAHADEHFSGKRSSWIGVVITCIGFVIGGVAFFPHPTWWLFWVAAGVAVVGVIWLVFAKTFTEDWY